MSKIAVVYWSGTGNTEAMAAAVVEGAKEKGAEVSLLTASEFSPEQVSRSMTPLPLAAPPWGRSSWRRVSLSPCLPPVRAG